MRSPASHNSRDSKGSHGSRNSYGSADNSENIPKPPSDRPPMVQRATSKDSTGSKSTGSKSTVQTSFKSPGISSMKKSSSRSKDPNQQTHNVDFALDFFTSKDPAEAKLIDVLEGNTEGKATGSRRAPSGGNLHRRKGSKLPFLVKQMSSRKLLNSSYGSKDSETLHKATFDATKPSSDSGLLSEGSQDANDNGAPLGNRRRTSSANRADFSSGNLRQRRASLHQNDLKPTSHYLSNLAEKLDESDAFDHKNRSDETQDKEGPSAAPGYHRRQKTTADAFADHAQHLENLFSAMPQDDYNDLPSTLFGSQRRDASQDIDDNCSDISEDDGDDDRDVEGGPDVRRPLLGRRGRHQRSGPFKRAYAYFVAFLTLLGPRDMWNGIRDFLHRKFLMVIVPLLSFSAILFYGFKNPDLAFMPTDATLSWWLIFTCRMLITFNLAKAAQYILTILTVRTTVTVRLAGPFVALIAMQSTGWPFLIAAFGGWNMLLCHGYHAFVKNWLWFLHIGMFNKTQNSDHGVLESTLYGRVLVSMIFVGVATAAKRTMVALYLSRRMLQYYRPQLQELLTDMKQVMEVAELAAETETEEFTQLVLDEQTSAQGSYRTASTGGTRNTEGARALARNATKKLTEQVPTFSSRAPASNLSLDTSNEGDDMLFSYGEEEEDDGDDESDDFVSTPLSERSGKSAGTGRLSKLTDGTESIRSGQVGPIQWNELKNQAKSKRFSSEKERSSSPIEMSSYAGEKKRTHQAKSSSNHRYDKLAPQLEDWEEPVEKGGKKSLPSLHDILQFRKAMEFMENPYPFSASFGPARTRKECIKSATRVYKRLLRFTPGEHILHFDVIGALAYDVDEDLDEQRAQELLGVFLPDKDDLLPQISFVQSCDYVYKHLRFLRASINNSSKIDSVLEDVFDCIFYGALTIIIMTMLGFNPWPLLVSFSTVMVSFAFAFGPSAAKWIEGTLMIAVRRPYDIGDRITINSAENLSHPTDSDTWLVEDISLTTTTLRFSSTNEVCTINNAAIANSRIVNCARSDRAIVTIKAYFVITATQDQIEKFRIRVENYLIDRPETWAGLVHFRNNMVDYNQGFVEYLIRAQHQQEWQYLSPIMVQKGELERFMNSVATDLGINWQYQSYRFRVMEVPRLITAKAEEVVDEDEDQQPSVEPFMKFIKEEAGY